MFFVCHCGSNERHAGFDLQGKYISFVVKLAAAFCTGLPRVYLRSGKPY